MVLLNIQSFAGLSLAIFLLAACGSVEKERVLDFDTLIHIDELPLKVAVFNTPETQALGLMRVPYLPENTGGLFVFDAEKEINLWMKNVWISLDFLFFDNQGQLTGWMESVQPCATIFCQRFPAGKVRYVLEVNGGFVKANKLSKPVHLHLPQ